REKYLVAPDAGGAQAVADLPLVLIDLRGVDVAIAEPQPLLDQRRADADAQRPLHQPRPGSSAQFPGAEPDRRDLCAVGLDEIHREVSRHRIYDRQPVPFYFAWGCSRNFESTPQSPLRQGRIRWPARQKPSPASGR